METNKWKCIIAEESNGKTTKEGVHANLNAVVSLMLQGVENFWVLLKRNFTQQCIDDCVPERYAVLF